MDAARCGATEKSSALRSNYGTSPRPRCGGRNNRGPKGFPSQQGPKNASPDSDWLLTGSVGSHVEIGHLNAFGHVNPYMLTRTLAESAGEKGARVVTLPPISIMQTIRNTSDRTNTART